MKKIMGFLAIVGLSIAMNAQAGTTYETTIRVNSLNEVGTDPFNAAVAVAFANKYGYESVAEVGDTFKVRVYYPIDVSEGGGIEPLTSSGQGDQKKQTAPAIRYRGNIVELNTLADVVKNFRGIQSFTDGGAIDGFMDITRDVGRFHWSLVAMVCSAFSQTETAAKNCVDISETVIGQDINGDGYVGHSPGNSNGDGAGGGSDPGVGGSGGSSIVGGGPDGNLTYTWWECWMGGSDGGTLICAQRKLTISL